MLKNLVHKATASQSGALQVQNRSVKLPASSSRHHNSHSSSSNDDERKQKDASESEVKPRSKPVARKRSSSSSSSVASSKAKTTRNKKPQASSSSKRLKPLMDGELVDDLASCLAQNKHTTRLDWLQQFQKYDDTQSGTLLQRDFLKCILKMGLKVDAKHEKQLIKCFEHVNNGRAKRKAKRPDRDDDDEDDVKRVAYHDFLHFGLFLKDPPRLDDLALALTKRIYRQGSGNTKNNSKRQWRALKELQRIDRKDSHFISVDAFEKFLKSPSDKDQVDLELDKKEIKLLVERFEYDGVGIDYQLFAWWLQPHVTMDMQCLHLRLKHWFEQVEEQNDELNVERLLSKSAVKGSLSLDRFRSCMEDMGLVLNDVQSRALAQEFGDNEDDEFPVEPFYEEIMASSASKAIHQAKIGKDKASSSSEAERRNKKLKTKPRQDSSSSSATETHKSQRMTKSTNHRNHRNTFSWGISKAFRFKKKPPHSQEDTDEDKAKHKSKTSKSSSHHKDSKPNSSNDSTSDSDGGGKSHRAARSHSAKSKKPTAHRSSSSEPEPSRHTKSAKKAKHDRTSDTSDDSSSNNKKPKKSTKAHKHASSSSAASSRASSRARSSSPQTKPNRRRSSIKSTKSATKVGHRKAKRRDRDESPYKTTSHHHRSSIRSVTRKGVLQQNSSTESNDEVPHRAHGRRLRKSRHASHFVDREDSSSTSGLELAQLRRFKNKQTKRKLKQRRAIMNVSSSDDREDQEQETDRGSKSDIEYQKQMKRALRRAFDFFDEDHSETIDKRELGNVLRAIGDNVSALELDEIMQNADLDHSGQIDFYEFYALVKSRIKQRGFRLSERTENQIRKAFEQLDVDQNGFVDEREFEYLIYKILQVELSVEEQNALLDEIDLNGDGVINIEEFIAFIRMIEKISDLYGSSSHHQHHQHRHHRRHHLLLGIPRSAFSAMKKIARGAPLDTDANLLAFLGVPSNYRAAITTTFKELKKNTLEYVLSFPPPLESIAELQKVESAQFHAIVSLKTARGVPRPFDVREEDVVSRTVHVCLYQAEPLNSAQQEAMTQEPHQGSGSMQSRKGTILGNIHAIPVYWSAKEEDVWQFSRAATKQDKYKFLVRTNLLNPDLYLLVEFIVKLRTSMLKNKATEDDQDEVQDDQRRVRSSATDDDRDKANVCARTIDMVCCWCKVPIRVLLAKRSDKLRLQEKLIGGTAISPIDIEQDEILRRRTGWRAITKAFTKFEFPNVGIKSVPIDWFAEDMRIWVRSMPPTIIASFASIPILYEYMKLMCEVLASLGGASSVVACEPVLKLLPKIIEDHEAINIFRRLFDDEMYNARTDADRQKKFQELVLRMWPSFVNLQAPIPVFALQQGLKSMASSAAVATAASAANGSSSSSNATRQLADSRTKLLECSANGNLHLADLDACCVPFHVREVGFERIL